MEDKGKILVETDRVYLREIVAGDDVKMFEMDSNPKVHHFLWKKPLTKIEESRECIRAIRQQYADTGHGRLALVLKETDEFLGWAGIKVEHNVNEHEEFFDLGYRLIEKHWSKGYATEATNALLKYGFTSLNLDVICAYAFTAHVASCRVLQKCGFRVVGDPFPDDGDFSHWFEYRKADYIISE